ncbi:MAG TPA: hypothetical protein VHE12_11130 [bacterium]|nr:hypothetical protein [bacterium]
MIGLTVKGLAKYMDSNSSKQRKILRDYKYPKPEGVAQTLYYAEARAAIRSFHQRQRDQAWLQGISNQVAAAGNATPGKAGVRLRNNAEVISAYVRYFGDKPLQHQGTSTFKHTHKGVRISLTPDLAGIENKIQKYIFLHLSAEPPTRRLYTIISQLLFLEVGKHAPVTNRNIEFIDVRRGVIHRVAKMRSRLSHEIEDACDNIEAIWPSI